MKKDIIKSQTNSIIRSAKKFANKTLTYCEALEILSNLYGFENYNVFSAWQKENSDFFVNLTTEVNNKIIPLFTQKIVDEKKYLTKPLSKKNISAKIKNEDFNIKEIIAVSLSDLLSWDMENLNDYADNQILGNNAYINNEENDSLTATLTDLSYKVVGHIEGIGYVGGQVLIEINAVLEIY